MVMSRARVRAERARLSGLPSRTSARLAHVANGDHCGAAIAAANGHAPSQGFMRSWEETFSQRDSQYATSMLRDVERGGPTEVEHILGFMLNKASEANIAHRTLLLAYTHIKAFEQRRAARRLP